MPDRLLIESLQSDGVRSSLDDASPTRSGILGLLTCSPLLISILCFTIAQLGKFAMAWFETREFKYERLIGSGGMPSAHSAFVSALATSVGVRDGTNTSTFAISVVLAAIVMYDAVGLRLHTGRQATAVNALVLELLPADHPVAPAACGRLRESLGHTPAEVAAGGVLGVLVAYLVQSLVGTNV